MPGGDGTGCALGSPRRANCQVGIRSASLRAATAVPPRREDSIMTKRTFTCWLCGLLAAAAVAAALPLRSLQAQQDPAADPFAATTPEADLAALENEDIEILTRGPVHEAFAEPVTFNAEPGLIAPKAVPAPIEEIAPAQRPAGESIWIPGYWAWSEDQNDFLWVSGIWRSPPPDYLEWVPGYWEAIEGGSQWVSGYWGSMEADEVAYLPNPPESLEQGPSSGAPGEDYFWVPGNWTWHENRYAWRTGFWTVVRPSWLWVPAHYVWTPSGCISVDGYWDRPLEDRGLLFAPVYYHRPIYTVADYYYTPSIVIDTGILTAHLFARPQYCHYYFGDYYEPSYYQNYGIYPWFVFHERHYGYDPLYVFFRYGRYSSRYDSWRSGLVSRYRWYRDHDDWRPGHNWREQGRQRDRWRDGDRDDIDIDIDIDIENNMIGKDINDRDFRDRNRLREASREEREASRDRSREVREFQRERARAEGEGGQLADGDEPRRVQRERSPLARQGDSEKARQRRANRLVEDAEGRSREIQADAQTRQRARLEGQRADRGERGERAGDRGEMDQEVPGPRGDRRRTLPQDDRGEREQRQQMEQRGEQSDQGEQRRRQEAQPQTRLRFDTSGEAERRAAQQEGASRERAQRQQQEGRSVERAPRQEQRRSEPWAQQQRSEPRVERSRSERSGGGESRQRSSGGGESRQRSSGGGERRESGGGGEHRERGGGKRDRD